MSIEHIENLIAELGMGEIDRDILVRESVDYPGGLAVTWRSWPDQRHWMDLDKLCVMPSEGGCCIEHRIVNSRGDHWQRPGRLAMSPADAAERILRTMAVNDVSLSIAVGAVFNGSFECVVGDDGDEKLITVNPWCPPGEGTAS